MEFSKSLIIKTFIKEVVSSKRRGEENHTRAFTYTCGVNNSLEIKQGNDKKRVKYLKEDLYTLFLALLRQKEVKLLTDEDIFFSLRSIRFDYGTDLLGRPHLQIGASRHTDTDIPEGLIRAALAIKYKDLNIRVHTIKV